VPERLLKRLAAGEEAALRECAEEFGPMLRGLARRYLRGRPCGEIDDAVGDILTEVWRSAGRYDEGRASEASFIATIAHRRLIDEVRARSRAGVGLAEPPTRHDASCARLSLEMREEAAAALHAFEALRPEAQTCLRSSLMHGLTQRRIAQTTGMPLGTVKSHMRDGLAALRFALDEQRRDRASRARSRSA